MIGPVTASRPGEGIVKLLPMPLQSADAPIDPLEIINVAGRRSVTSGRPPMLSISHRPASSGFGSTGRLSSARVPVARAQDECLVIRFRPGCDLVEETGQSPLARSRIGPRHGLGS
jgi:hypothetical protein